MRHPHSSCVASLQRQRGKKHRRTSRRTARSEEQTGWRLALEPVAAACADESGVSCRTEIDAVGSCLKLHHSAACDARRRLHPCATTARQQRRTPVERHPSRGEQRHQARRQRDSSRPRRRHEQEQRGHEEQTSEAPRMMHGGWKGMFDRRSMEASLTPRSWPTDVSSPEHQILEAQWAKSSSHLGGRGIAQRDAWACSCLPLRLAPRCRCPFSCAPPPAQGRLIRSHEGSFRKCEACNCARAQKEEARTVATSPERTGASSKKWHAANRHKLERDDSASRKKK